MAQIDKPSLHFNTVLYTGNGGTNAITGVGFQPDIVWIKARSYNDDHTITDAVRGVNKAIYPNNTTAENSGTRVTAFGTDGFTLASSGDVNSNNATYVNWSWKANGAGSSNSDGSITSTVSANTTAGCSIVKYTGTGSNATVGHGLGAAPKMVIVRRISPGGEWYIHAGQLNDNEKVLVLNTTAAEANASTVFNNTAPTSSVFSLGTNGDANGNTYEHIAYCFAEKKGFSKFGKYTANGNADGTFVYTGFKPAWLMIKKSSATENWLIVDNKRDTYNTVQNTLLANTNNSEFTGTDRVDFLSNGFKCRTATGGLNDSGTFIYMAFAENPIVGSNNVPAVAR